VGTGLVQLKNGEFYVMVEPVTWTAGMLKMLYINKAGHPAVYRHKKYVAQNVIFHPLKITN